MIQPQGSFSLSKSRKLLKSKDFVFEAYQRFQSQLFTFISSNKGRGRLGISLSKKVLSDSVARNRIKRLIREAFRLSSSSLAQVDLHVIGRSALAGRWKTLRRQDLDKEIEGWIRGLQK